uniref:Transmembrane protein n=1 Tax=Noccaea caerulescens TaxID=107243 RepID=A0A1J3CU95_NOCCA
MASNSREARRRKILERGSDRLAFITGQINGAPPPPSSDSTSLSQSQLRTDESLPETIPSRDQILTDPEIGLTSQQEDILDASMLDNMEQIIHQSRAESLQPRRSTETMAEDSVSDARETTLQPSHATSSAQTTSVVDLRASQAFTPLVSYVNAITPNHIGTAIDASVFARMFAALVIALLVILSQLGFSSLGNVVSFRPVFLLLLTDATIVFGRVLLSHHGDHSSASRRENSGTVMNGQGIADQVGNALETIMMVKKIMDAISMDFSLYAVILICGLLCTQSIFA